MSKNICIQAPIRDVIPSVGKLPSNTITINLAEYKSKIKVEYLSLPFMYTAIQQIISANNINQTDIINLYIVAPNSVNIIVPFILSRLGYQYSILPKPTDSDHWGFVNNDVKFKDPHSFLHEMKAMDILKGFDCCIKLQGKFPINRVQEVYIRKNDKSVRIERILTQVNNIDKFDKIYTTHRLTLPEIYTSLTDKKVCQQFEEDFQKIMDELLAKKAKRIHILSSIPAIGLQIIGKIIAQEPYRDMDFCLYDFESENQYHLVSALNVQTLQNLINKGE